MCKKQLLFLILVWSVKVVYGRKYGQDLVYQHSEPVRQRLSEIRKVLVPQPQDQWDHLLRHLATFVVPIHAASDVCRNHSQHLLKSFLDQEIWAYRMVDASSKIQSGILDGNLQNLGNYAQCVSVYEPNKLFRGQHCVFETTGFLPPEIFDEISRKPLPFIDSELMISLCVPSSCSDLDVITHINHILAPLGVSAKSYLEELSLSTDIKQISCSTPQGIPFRTKDYVAIFLFALIAALVLLASLLRSQSGWLSCFTFQTNFRELMDTTATPAEISCLNGLRVLLAILIISGHRAFLIWVSPTNRLLTIVEVLGSVFPVVFFDLLKAKGVDLFFLIGGCVLSFNFFLRNQKMKKFDYFNFCLKRYFRLTPLLAAVMLFHATLLVHMSHGPLWLRNIAEFEDKCYVNWWAGLLHISGLVVPQYMCVGESWHVACDFMFHCFAPISLLLLLRKPQLGFVSIAFCSLLSIALTTAAALYFGFSSGYFYGIMFGDRLTDLHIPIFYRGAVFRASTFFMGLFLGYIMFCVKQRKAQYTLSKQSAWIGWILCLTTFAALTAVTFEVLSPDHEFMPLLDPLYLAFSRIVFCACFSWFIFACYYGAGGSVNEFLSWSGFHVIAKLGYGAYHVHSSLQVIQVLSLEHAIVFSFTEQIFLLAGDILISFLVAIILHTFIEVPFYKLANHIIDGNYRKRKPKQR
ncbi:O-acyltransferase like protein-like [Macrosteles quadrilineatus]|uniref:O-acyltransferase like protein-like n=1 Tax=Macrosteles quadrilineatus TaxID=74068 RepID=UPI0023E2C4F3|nr:O-acyltransferase like protein-like [Macrosteles quadrilineatus]